MALTDTMICEECGNHSVEPSNVEGHRLSECSLCGHVSGEPEAVQALLDMREARAEGVDAEVFPLVRTLRDIGGSGGIHILRSSGGDAFLRLPPHVLFEIRDDRLCRVENIMRSLEYNNRALHEHWTLHMFFDGDLRFQLGPVAGTEALDELRVERLQSDMRALATMLRRDSGLSWWKP